jgi:hypothetical protein
MIENREARLRTLVLALTLGLATAAFIIAKETVSQLTEARERKNLFE